MARYSAFLGLQVEVQYRAGDILLPASGTFVGDTGRSVFLEQSFEQRGQHRQFRWEIPYQYIVRLAEKLDPALPATNGAALIPKAHPVEAESTTLLSDPSEDTQTQNATAAKAAFGSNISVLFPRPQRSDV